MKLLEQVVSGKTPAPRRLMLYGTHAIGKSSFAACAPKPIFLQTEDGLGEIECDKLPVATTFNEAMKGCTRRVCRRWPGSGNKAEPASFMSLI